FTHERSECVYIISMYAAFPLLPLAKLMFYKEFSSPILFRGKFQGQKLDFQGQLLAFQGQNEGQNHCFPEFQGQK
ncbi:TPA: hypothetical protein ACGE91_004889, partial [Escherichia coli]